MSAQAPLPPLRFAPLYKEKVWGGARLASLLNRAVPAGAPIGESWEISGHGTDQTRVEEGSLAGRTVGEVLAGFGRELTGYPPSAGPFPLLYKFIDANDRLSVQVHPDDTQAQAHGWGVYGKTECWYIVHAEPGAQTIAGFNRPVTRGEIEDAIRAGALPELLNFVDIAAGDLVLIPAGTVHANLTGTLLYEVQQTSDTTLRFFDWDRNDPSRPLHVAESLEVVDTTFHHLHKIPAVMAEHSSGVTRRFRVACRYFAIVEYGLGSGAEIHLPEVRSFQVLTCLAGDVVVHGPGDPVRVAMGRTILLPASIRRVRITALSPAQMLVSWVPDLREEVIGPLRTRGIPDSDIEALGGNPAKNDLRPIVRSQAK